MEMMGHKIEAIVCEGKKYDKLSKVTQLQAGEQFNIRHVIKS